MALLLEQKEVYDIIKGYDGKLEEPTANPTDTGKAAFKDWMNRHGVARSTIPLGMQPWIQAEYTVVDDVKTFWEKLGSAYKSKLKCNIFEIREDLWSIKLQDCRDVDNYPSWIAQKVNNYNLCAEPTVPSTTDTDAPNMDSAKTIPKASEQEHIFHLLLGIPRNDEWKVVLELMRNKNATMTTTPDEIITKLVEKEAAIKIDNGLTPQALLFAKKGGKGGNGGKAGKGGKSPKRDMRDKKRDNNRKEKDLRKCLHCQRRGRITENHLCKQRGNPPENAHTAAKASTETTSTLTTSIENYWMAASLKASSSDWFIHSGCTTHISGRRSMFITYTKYLLNTQTGKGYDGVTSFESGYGNVRLTWQLPDGKTEMMILQEVVNLPGLFTLISQSRIMDKDVEVDLVNHYGLNLYNCLGKSIATAPQVDGILVLVRGPD